MLTLKAYSGVYDDSTDVIPQTVTVHVLVSADCVIRSFTTPAASSLDQSYYVWADTLSLDMTQLFLPEPTTCSGYTHDEVFTWTIPSTGAAYITNAVNDIIEISSSTLDAVAEYTLTVAVVITVNENPGAVKIFNPASVDFKVTIVDTCLTATYDTITFTDAAPLLVIDGESDTFVFSKPNLNYLATIAADQTPDCENFEFEFTTTQTSDIATETILTLNSAGPWASVIESGDVYSLQILTTITTDDLDTTTEYERTHDFFIRVTQPRVTEYKYVAAQVLVRLGCDCSQMVWIAPASITLDTIQMKLDAATFAADKDVGTYAIPTLDRTTPLAIQVCYDVVPQTLCDETGAFTVVQVKTDLDATLTAQPSWIEFTSTGTTT